MLRMILGALILAQAAAIPAAAPARLGDIRIAYDPAAWRVAPIRSGLRFECAGKDCRSYPVLVTRVDGKAAPCSQQALEGRMGQGGSSRALSLPSQAAHAPLTVIAHDLGCRNLVAPSIAACVTIKGSTYMFDAAPGSCAPAPGGDDGIVDLLSAVTAR